MGIAKRMHDPRYTGRDSEREREIEEETELLMELFANSQGIMQKDRESERVREGRGQSSVTYGFREQLKVFCSLVPRQ